MTKQISPGALIAIMVVIVALIGVFAWRVLAPHTSTAGQNMTQWDQSKQPPAVRARLQQIQATGGKLPPP